MNFKLILKHLPNFALIFSNFMEIPTRFMTSMVCEDSSLDNLTSVLGFSASSFSLAVVVEVVVMGTVVVVEVVVVEVVVVTLALDASSLASGTLFSIGGEHRQHDTETTKETIKNKIFMMMMPLLTL